MKILIVSTLYPPHVVGGAEKAAAQLAEGLVRRGHRVAVASLHPGADEVIDEQNGVRVYRLPLDNFYWPFGRNRKPNPVFRMAWHLRDMWNPTAARRIGRVLDAEQPDIVNTHNVCGFSLALWREVKRRNIRLVHTLHDYYLMCPRCTLFKGGRNCHERCSACKVLTFSHRRSARLPDAIVSVSQHALDEHTKRNYLRSVPATVIYNIQGSMAAGRRPQNTDAASADLVFGFIGRVEEVKGIETLLAATLQLHSPRWKLRIAGKGAEPYVKNLARRFPDPRIEWLGFTDAANFYSSVDVVVVPSLWAEPLPYVCVESLQAGKSLICALSGGIPEIARLSNVAEFFQAGNTDALAQKMNQALDEIAKWRNPGVPSMERLAGFREEHIVDEYLHEYAPPVKT